MEKNLSLFSGFAPAVEPMPAYISADLSEPGLRAKLDEKISNIFLLIGIPAHTTGYHYLRQSIKLAAGNFEMVNSITKKLYPLVADHFKTSTCKVARGIRNAIEIAWNKGKIININAVLGINVLEKNDKPSNGELIALLAEKIYLDGM